jgi:hypothetical protein
VNLFRVIHWDGHSLGKRGAGPLFVPRSHQGAGRHDAPDRYGAWYCTTEPTAAVAERIQAFRGQTVTDGDFARLGNLRLALVAMVLSTSVRLIDLDEPAELTARAWRPSLVATRRRSVTQQMGRTLFDEGAVGFSWWSTLSAEWTNITLFYERAVRYVRIVGAPRPLATSMLEVQRAADDLGVRLG